jgi:hypothetical protein
MEQIPILEVKSRDEGRNADVRLFPDRIERVLQKKFGSIGRAHQDAEVIPIKNVSSVQAKKDGLAYTKVTLFASGNTIEFRLSHAHAQQFRDAVTQLVLGSHPSQQAAPANAPVGSAPPPPPPPPAQPAGWHPDPSKRHELRYFDGARWTEHVSDQGLAAVDPV